MKAVLLGLVGGLLGATCAAGEPAPVAVLDTMAQRMQACTACHGKEGRATNQGYFPRIAGKPVGYLYNQFINFRDGRRQNGTMAHLLAHTSDAYLLEAAEYFAGLELPYPAPTATGGDRERLARGRNLVFEGDAGRGIPACARCHGDALTGVAPAIPGLLGVPPSYVVAQIGAWRNGSRTASAPDCMADIARRLSEEEVSAVAAWLSSQPMPVDARPARARALPPLPVACGSASP
jgi:cytochrome c553